MHAPADIQAHRARACDQWTEILQSAVVPYARQIDREASVPGHVIDALRAAGAFASGFPEALGGTSGSSADPVAATLAHGAMHEALGRASASVQGLVNVHHMGGSAVARWGIAAQKERWVPQLTSGALLCGIAITEPEVGSDISAVKTFAKTVDGGFEVTGEKAWITCGASADLFVLVAAAQGGPVALLLPKTTPGLQIHPIDDMLGCRGYMMARLVLDGVFLPSDHLLGRPGFGATYVAATGLESGRYNLAWGCVGLAEAALSAAMAHTKTREQFGQPIGEFQLVQRLIAIMMTDIHAARLMCQSAGVARGEKAMQATKEATMAKYFASQMVNRVTRDAQQLLGAQGIGSDTPMAMYFRDARVMEVIEGTTQVLETLIARFGYAEAVS